MNKSKILMLMLGISLLLSGCKKEEEVVTEVAPPPSPPTIEETLGYTGYDLLERDLVNPYNQVQLNAKIDMTATHKNNIVDYVYESTMSHESDGFNSYIVTLESLTNEFGTKNNTYLTWFEKEENTMKYYNDNYTGWYYTEGICDNLSVKLHNSSAMTYTELIPLDTLRVKVKGTSSTENNSYFDKYIKSVVNQFGIVNCTYNYEANYDFNTKEFISVIAEVNIPGEITHGEYICTVDSFTVTMTSIKSDTLKRLTIPDNCKNGVYVPSETPEEVTEEPIPVEETIEESTEESTEEVDTTEEQEESENTETVTESEDVKTTEESEEDTEDSSESTDVEDSEDTEEESESLPPLA